MVNKNENDTIGTLNFLGGDLGRVNHGYNDTWKHNNIYFVL